jgi:hypothetical protein
VAIGRRHAIDRLVERQPGADAARGQAAQTRLGHGFHRAFQRGIVHRAGAVGIDIERQRLRHADGIGHLDRAALGQARRDDVLGDIARHIGGRAVHLGRVLARKRAAAMGRRAAIGIDDDLAPGQARVAIRAADLEAAGGVDVIDRLVREQLGRDHRGHGLLHPGFQLGILGAFVIARLVLGGDDDGGAGGGAAILEAQGHLALGVGFEEGAAPVWRSCARRWRILWL